MDHMHDVRMARGQAVGDLAGAIRRIVIDDQDADGVEVKRQEFGHNRRQIVRFIIGGNDDNEVDVFTGFGGMGLGHNPAL